MDFSAYARGFVLGFGLIVAIGAQNAYVLTRGIHRNHHWAVAAVCSVVDIILIAVGILGMGALLQSWPGALTAVTAGGVLFLFVYGLISFRNMLHKESLRTEGGKVGLKVAVTTALALSLLNPHVYLDTVILLGSIALQEVPGSRADFGVGAASASITWFFLLALGGQSVQHWFQTVFAWRVLDGLVGIIMWVLAFNLARQFFFN